MPTAKAKRMNIGGPPIDLDRHAGTIDTFVARFLDRDEWDGGDSDLSDLLDDWSPAEIAFIAVEAFARIAERDQCQAVRLRRWLRLFAVAEQAEAREMSRLEPAPKLLPKKVS